MSNIFKGLVVLALPLASFEALSMSLDWSGTLREEYTEVSSSYLTGTPQTGNPDVGRKNYFLNHLNLSPKIIAIDGVNIIANMEIFPSTTYPGTQLGTDFGGNPYTGTGAYPASSPSGDISQGRGATSLEVNQVYMTWNQEYGELVAGRMPIDFGLGIAHNGGTGMFDHWLETHDIVGYKFLVGNLSFMPMYGRTSRTYGYGAGGYGTEGMLEVNYTSPESDSTIALFHQIRSAGPSANDGAGYFAPYEAAPGGPSVVGGSNTTLTSLYFAKGWSGVKLKFEAAFQSGSTGIQYNIYQPEAGYTQAGTTPINFGGFGLAMELSFPRPDSKWQWNFRGGMATGDNPLTQNYEGFAFNRNYNIAMLLFNHPLGQTGYDVLSNSLNRQRDSNNNLLPIAQTADEAQVSNAIYFSPKVDYLFSDHWEWNNAVTYAVVQSNPSALQSGTGSDLGFEWDTGITFKPHEKFRWINTIGMFMPGTVFQEGPAGRSANFIYGIESKAAISF